MAVRTALGGTRARLVRQLLTENVLLAAAAGALGLGVAQGVLGLLVKIDPGFLGGRYDVEMSPQVFAFACATAPKR